MLNRISERIYWFFTARETRGLFRLLILIWVGMLLFFFTGCDDPTPDPACSSDAECRMDADCGTNQTCQNCECSCTGGDPACAGTNTIGSTCNTIVEVQWGIYYDANVIGTCNESCQCNQCQTDTDCPQHLFCDQATHTCQPRTCTASSCSDCPSFDCFQAHNGSCSCLSTFDLFGCPVYSECVNSDGNSLFPGGYCLSPNGIPGTCNYQCNCEIDACPALSAGPCRDLADGDTCQIAANTQTISGYCHDCRCLCPGSSPCAGLEEGFRCELFTDFWGNCKDCNCETCPEDSLCYGKYDGFVCTTSNGQPGNCFNCQCKPKCPENSPCQNKRENDPCVINGQSGTCQNCECVVCQDTASSCYQESTCATSDSTDGGDCLGCLCCPYGSDQCNTNTDCFSGICDTSTCNCEDIPSPPPPPPPQPGDDPTPTSTEDLCAENGGVQWQGEICDCSGYVDLVTVCTDGTKIDQVSDRTCSPDPDRCDSDDGDEDQCPCRRVCLRYRTDGSCAVYDWRDCNDQSCQP